MGYGDVAFDTVTGRAVATVWLLCSTMVTASSVGILAAYRAESKQHALVHQKICRKFTQSDFATADMDKDGDIDEFEFVVFKLIEIEMVDPVFVERVRAQFRASGAESLGKTRYSPFEYLEQHAVLSVLFCAVGHECHHWHDKVE